MTTLTWIYIVAGLLMGTIALTLFLTTRATRRRLPRSLLPFYVSQLVIWSFFGVMFFSGVLLLMFLATISIINVSPIIWILRLPKDDHVV